MVLGKLVNLVVKKGRYRSATRALSQEFIHGIMSKGVIDRAQNWLNFILFHFSKEGRGKLDASEELSNLGGRHILVRCQFMW